MTARFLHESIAHGYQGYDAETGEFAPSPGPLHSGVRFVPRDEPAPPAVVAEPAQESPPTPNEVHERRILALEALVADLRCRLARIETQR